MLSYRSDGVKPPPVTINLIFAAGTCGGFLPASLSLRTREHCQRLGRLRIDDCGGRLTAEGAGVAIRRMSRNSWILAAIPSAQITIQTRLNFNIKAGVSAASIPSFTKHSSEIRVAPSMRASTITTCRTESNAPGVDRADRRYARTANSHPIQTRISATPIAAAVR